jgi:hypothetical protein
LKASIHYAVVSLLAVLAGCSAATNDPGVTALLRVSSKDVNGNNAQFYRGPAPADSGGPTISSFNNTSNVIIPGQVSKPLSGIVPPNAGAIALYLDGDAGYWLVLPGAADATQLNQLTWSASLSFSPLLPAGDYVLVGQAVGLDGKFGPRSTAKLSTADQPPPGALVIALRWDVNADLDLHVVDPAGVEIWAKHIADSGGLLDFDSNSNCVIDGRRQEDVIWAMTPPSGHYIARVDTASLCSESIAVWSVAATLNGTVVAASTGFGRDTDAALYSHEQGAGVLALQFDVP